MAPAFLFPAKVLSMIEFTPVLLAMPRYAATFGDSLGTLSGSGGDDAMRCNEYTVVRLSASYVAEQFMSAGASTLLGCQRRIL
jgi:hypothetical protein